MSEVRGLIQAIAVVKNCQKQTFSYTNSEAIKTILQCLIKELNKTIDNKRNFTDWELGRIQSISLIREYQLECLNCQSDELKAKRENIATANPEFFKSREKLLSNIIKEIGKLSDPTIVDKDLIQKALSVS